MRLDLPGGEQEAQAEVVDPDIVADGVQVPDALPDQRLDEVFGNAAEPKPPTMRVAPSWMSCTASSAFALLCSLAYGFSPTGDCTEERRARAKADESHTPVSTCLLAANC